MASVIAALNNVRLPTVSLQSPIDEDNPNMQIDSNYRTDLEIGSNLEEAVSLRDLVIDHERQQPLSLTLPSVRAIFRSGAHWFVDPLPEEEAAADAAFLAILSPDNPSSVASLIKQSGSASLFTRSDLKDLLFHI
jgi:hypothetical protein